MNSFFVYSQDIKPEPKDKEMEVIISEREKLLELLHQTEYIDSNCNHTKYLQWANKDTALTNNLVKIGEVENPINWANQTNYWGENAPIELDKYPYWACEIHRCNKCQKLFFHYPEDGGHNRQLRYRMIRPELLIDTSVNKYMNLAIPRGLESFFKIFQEDLGFDDKYENTWDGLWNALVDSDSMPLKYTLYNFDVFKVNYKEEANQLVELADRFNKLGRKQRIKVKAGNI